MSLAVKTVESLVLRRSLRVIGGLALFFAAQPMLAQEAPKFCTATWYSPGGSYDTGSYPAVSMNKDGFFVEEHNWGNGDKRLLYAPGRFVSGVPKFGKPTVVYDTGFNPSVAVNSSGVVVDVHVDTRPDGTNGKLYYRLGHIDPNGDINTARIAWDTGGGGVAFGGGFAPSVAINDEGWVVLAWRTNNIIYPDRLYATFGKVSRSGSGYAISWYKNQEKQYDDGADPHVSIDSSNEVIEVHRGKDGKLYSRRGFVNSRLNEFGFVGGPVRSYADTSYTPAIALAPTGQNVVETHVAWGGRSWDLHFLTGKISLADVSLTEWSGLGYVKPAVQAASLTSNGTYALEVNTRTTSPSDIQMEYSYADLKCP